MIVLKFFGKVVSLILPWETILGFIIELAAKLLKNWLEKKDFSKKAKYFTMGIYVLVEGIGEELANDTRTSVDNKLISEVINLCKKSAIQEGFKLPDVEEL